MEKGVVKKCCVIIVTYNGKKWIEECIESVLSSEVKLDLIIVDNGSNDGTLELIKSKCEPYKIFNTGENLGFGKANNLGITYAFEKGFEYFFLLNQDAYLNRDTIGNLLSTYEDIVDVGILSPIHLTGDGKNLDHGFQAGIKSPSFVSQFQKNEWKKRTFKVPFVNAAAWMIRRDALLEVGLFHPLFFHYGEDKNYVKRVLKKRLKIVVCADAIIQHDREKRGENKLKEDPDKNRDRVMRQIILNPLNPPIKLLLKIYALNKMNVISKGWSMREKKEFISSGFELFEKIWSEAKSFGMDYNPLLNLKDKNQ